MWLDSSQTVTRTLLLCVRTRIHPKIEEKQGQMQLYQQLHRHGMQDRSRSRKETSNLKVLMEAGIKPGQTVVRR